MGASCVVVWWVLRVDMANPTHACATECGACMCQFEYGRKDGRRKGSRKEDVDRLE